MFIASKETALGCCHGLPVLAVVQCVAGDSGVGDRSADRGELFATRTSLRPQHLVQLLQEETVRHEEGGGAGGGVASGPT